MADCDDTVELLFFDTFSHEINEDLNLDLVQFPKPVFITEVRIIPLGARVQADFPGGVRLGATNPSKFGIELFVNDLGKPGASAFEILGKFEYNQNDCIHLECQYDKIPTDGLVLRGWYTTITLAIYGTLTKNISEQIASPPLATEPIAEEVSIIPVQVPATELIAQEIPTEWRPEVVRNPNPAPETTIYDEKVYKETSFEEPFEQAPYNEECFYQSPAHSNSKDSEKRPERRKSRSMSRNRTYSRSDSNDREYNSVRQKREWSRSPEYRRSRRPRRDRSREIEHTDREHKRPRTPPSSIVAVSPRKPRSPEHFANAKQDVDYKYRQKLPLSNEVPPRTGVEVPPESFPATEPIDDIATPTNIDEDTMSQDEPFEPILSDDEIGDDNEMDDIEMEENDFEEVFTVFDPYKMPLNKFEIDMDWICARDFDILVEIFSEIQLRVQTKEAFIESSASDKETFLHISEKLINHLQKINYSLLRYNYALKKIVKYNQNAPGGLSFMARAVRIALDFECAFSQPQCLHMLRHIKIATRVTELLSASTEFMEYLVNVEECDPFKNLFDIYEKDNMSLSIKLSIFKAIYTILDTKYGVKLFLNKFNGYQRLLAMLREDPLTRIKFAIRSIIRKLNFYESLETIQDLVTKYFVLTNHYLENPFQSLEFCLAEVKKAISTNANEYQQPRIFLPVSKKFEVVKDLPAQKGWEHMLRSYFKIHTFAESLLLIISNQDTVPLILIEMTLDIIELLLESTVGIDYLSEDCFDTTQLIVKCLLGVGFDDTELTETEGKNEEDSLPSGKKKIESLKSNTRAKNLGLKLAYTVQGRYHIDTLSYVKDDEKLNDHLHILFSQTCDYSTRVYTADVIGMNNNILTFIDLVEKERKFQCQRQQGSPTIVKCKSPVLSYAVDLIDCCVRYCNNLQYLEEHCNSLLDLVKSHEVFEQAISTVLQEMAVYLKPVEAINNFSYHDVSPLFDIIKRNVEFVTTFPGDLIMALRMLCYLGVDEQNKETELKYRYVILQFYSADGVITLLKILEKLNTYFEQPGLHTATLMSSQAVSACQIVLPSLSILREILTYAIECRDTKFKDLTAVEHLLKSYCLMHYVPELSPAYGDAQKIKTEIVNILLAYTQPNPEEQDNMHKSLWTQMIREVIKFVLRAPYTFVPGLQVFIELLPLPLPIHSLHPLTEMESQRLITERKLWSAHLHPQGALLTELIQAIMPTSYPQLNDLIVRTCLQLADLAPNITLLVSKSICDAIVDDAPALGIGTAALARLLKFLGQLTAYGPIKTSTLSIYPGRLHEIFIQILNNSTDTSTHHLKCQENIHHIYESLLDSEVSMIVPSLSGNPELNLACALPSKELIGEIASAILLNLIKADVSGPVAMAASRNLIILTEHDITIFHLRNTLEEKKVQFQEWFHKFITEDGSLRETNVELVAAVVVFLRAMIVIDNSGSDGSLPSRTIKLNAKELGSILGLNTDDDCVQMLKRLRESLKGESEQKRNLIEDILTVQACFDNCDSGQAEVVKNITEPELPQAEGIVTQFLSRPIYVLFDSNDSAHFSVNYWLESCGAVNSYTEQDVAKIERISCDLIGMADTYLPSDTNLTSECKRILHLSASPQSNRERTTATPCFRTRRVEVEPTTGRPEKKIFVTPMRGRGFTRTPPSRSDLFRSRPPNTSRPPSLHVDDFLALETCGAQPTGPTGYNKISRDIINIRGSRIGRGRSNRIATASGSSSYRYRLYHYRSRFH